jgi:tetratricopeptide (TPR) repeat protein
MQSSGNKLDWEFEDFAHQLNLEPSAYENTNSKQNKPGRISRISTIINSPSYKILFVFDNCDNYDNAAIYINQLKYAKNTAILLTTRDPEVCKNLKLNQNEFKIVKLKPFNRKESFQYLKLVMKDHTESKNPGILEKLLDLIEFEEIRPYYLRKFVSFVLLKVGYTSTLSSFINEFKNNREDLMNMIYNDSDNTIFKMMNDEDSFILIKYAAFLDPDFIPVDIFTKVFSIEKRDMENYIDMLLKLSMISVEERKFTSAVRIESNNLQSETETLKGIKIHRTLKNETEQYLNHTKEYSQILSNLTIKFHNALEKKSNFLKNKYFYYNFRELTAKSLSLASGLIEPRIYLSFGVFIFKKEFMPNDECLKYFEKVLLDLQKKQALTIDESLIYVDTLYYYAHLNSKYEKTDDVLKYLEQALTILETLDKSEENIMKKQIKILNGFILVKIFCVYIMKEEHNRSIEYYLKSLLVIKDSGKINYEDLAHRMKIIGQVYNQLDNNTAAIKYYDDAPKIQRDLYISDNNEHIAKNLYHFANILNSDGVRDYKKSIDFYEKSLELYTTKKTDKIFMIIDILNSIGFAYFNLKNYTKSLEYLNRSLTHRLEIYQSYEDSGIAMTLNNIGMVKNHLNENKEALETFNKSLSIIKKIYSEDNMNVANIYNNIGMVFCDFGDYKEALNYLEKALTIKQSKNNKSLTVANTLNNIGIVYSLSEQDDKAINFFEQSLEIKNNLFSDSHFNVNQTKENLKIINQKINSSVFQKFLLFFYKKFFPYNYGYEKSLEYIWSDHVCFD